MRRRNPENVLQVESAKLGSEKETHEKKHVEPTFETRRGSPIVWYPIVRAKLTYDAFELPTERWNVPETTPVVRFHCVVLARFHAQIDSESIAYDHIENPLKEILAGI